MRWKTERTVRLTVASQESVRKVIPRKGVRLSKEKFKTGSGGGGDTGSDWLIIEMAGFYN